MLRTRFPRGGRQARFHQAHRLRSDFKTQEKMLEVRCKCKQTGFKARGSSALNFITHSPAPRHASGDPHLSGSGFNPNQIEWINPERIIDSSKQPEYMPQGSSNPHYFCNCEKKTYLGLDATRLLGMVILNHKFADSVDDSYRPNHHLFYKYRVRDADDKMPKWETTLQGDTTVESSQGERSKEQSCQGEWNDTSGMYRKDVRPISPTRAPDPSQYEFTTIDPPVNHVTRISADKVQERVASKYNASPGLYVAPAKNKRDAIIIGGGHNGLVSAAYLAKSGLDTLVLERRHIVGGAAVTEEIVPGFHFSRGSYLAGLLRPQIIEDLNLPTHGFKYISRDPSSFTPTTESSVYGGKYLMLGEDAQKNWQSIAQFSERDADNYEHYEEFLGQVREIVTPLLDSPLPNPLDSSATFAQTLSQLVKVGHKNREALVPLYELLTAPATHILERWFESEMLKTTLATDAVIGANYAPSTPGSAYVLLHHVMGEAAGKKGVWSYVEGGMGAISDSIAASAKLSGAEICTNATVQSILYEEAAGGGHKARGVLMDDGSEILAPVVISNATPYHTFLELLPGLSRDSGNADEFSPLPRDFAHHIRFTDYSCGALKINCAVDRLPNFSCLPSHGDAVGPQHRGTVHFETKMEELEVAFREASMGMPASRPVVEMTMPSALDPTIAPAGKHIVQLFVQYAPYDLDPKVGNWADEGFKDAFADRVFGVIDEYCPGFSQSVIGRDVLSPLDLERIFGLHKGNIFHGSLSLHQLGYARPMSGFADHRSPIKGLYMCSAGCHPGGGVMGAAGKNCAQVVQWDVSAGAVGK